MNKDYIENNIIYLFNIMESILNIFINAITLDGKISNDLEFHPYMLDKSSFQNYDYVLISPYLKMSKDELPKTEFPNDKLKVFFSLDLFKKMMFRTRDVNNIDPNAKLTMNPNILTSNIDFVLNSLFPYDSHIDFNNKQYTIYSYTWDGKYTINNQTKREVPMININIRLIIYEGNTIPFYDGLRLSCMERKRELLRNKNELLNIKENLDITTKDYASQPIIQNADGTLQNQNPYYLKRPNYNTTLMQPPSSMNNTPIPVARNVQFAGKRFKKTKRKRVYKNKPKHSRKNYRLTKNALKK